MPSTYGFVPGVSGVPLNVQAIGEIAEILAAGGPNEPRPFFYEAWEVTRAGPGTTYISPIFGEFPDGSLPPSPIEFGFRIRTTFKGEPDSFVVPVVFGGGEVPKAAGLLTRIDVGQIMADGSFETAFFAKGLVPFTGTQFLAALSDSVGYYAKAMVLFDNDTVVDGTPLNDRLEVGAGNDTVRAGAGDDVVFKWKSGDLDYSGGPGHDALEFGSDGPSSGEAEPFVEMLDIDLGAGIGRSPFGGAITLTSVEEIRTTRAADRVIGSKRADTVDDIYGGADDFRLKRGDDSVSMFSFFKGAYLDGGKGQDSLSLVTSGFGGYDPALGYGRQVLDLARPGRNIEDFEGVVVRSFESVRVGMTQSHIHLDLKGTKQGESLEVSNSSFVATGSLVRIFGRGGDDNLLGGIGEDILFGGVGNDTLGGRGGDGDVLKGGKGADTLLAGYGIAKFFGGAGSDTFAFNQFFTGIKAVSMIMDFTPGKDVLDFAALAGIENRGDLDIRGKGGNTLILYGDDDRIVLNDVAKADLDSGDFLF